MRPIPGSLLSIFVREYVRGTPYKEIAALVGRSIGTVRHWKNRAGLSTRPKTQKTKDRRFIGFYIEEHDHTLLTRVARKEGMSKSEWMRKIIGNKLREYR